MTKNVVIIGGTSGIGLHVARYLNDHGYRVLIGSRNKIKEISGIDYLQIDVTDEFSIQQFFDLIPFKSIDSIIYAAGITTPQKKIEDFDKNEYMKVHDVNLLGAILTLKYVYPFLKETKGKVVVVNSIASRTYSKFSGFEYTVSKAGLSGLIRQLSIEWAKDTILINSINPSMVETPMLKNNVDPVDLRLIENQIPLGRIAKPNEIAKLIEFLISDKNTYITGSGVDINGGQFLTG
jgi:2-dehydro-3-deoxy-D-gluconate 5-dehydrogenase